jgi:hypothetical protein
VIVEGIQSATPGAKVVPEEYRPPDEKTALHEKTAQPGATTAQASAK